MILKLGGDEVANSGMMDNRNNNNWQRTALSFMICVVVYFVTKPSSVVVADREAATTTLATATASPIPDSEHQKVHQASHVDDEFQGMVSHTNNTKLGFWLKEGLPDEYTPHIVWLMAWPQSGEDYVMKTIEHVTNLSVATNYGDEVTPPGFYSIPIYPRRPDEGPYWEGLGVHDNSMRRKLPVEYVLVKTHCSHGCYDNPACKPRDYYEEPLERFVAACTATRARAAPTHPSGHRSPPPSSFRYPISRVKKSVHLLRNPFHAVVHRFLDEQKKTNGTAGSERYASGPLGFQKWCSDASSRYETEQEEVYEEHFFQQYAKKTICHAEFYKYIQWHNHAFTTTATYLDASSPSSDDNNIVIKYEDFQQDFEGTITKLVKSILHLKRMAEPYKFPDPHDYSSYYTTDMREDIKQFCKSISNELTWTHVRDYFDNDTILF